MKKQYTSYELMQILKGIFTDPDNDFSIKEDEKVLDAHTNTYTSNIVPVDSIVDYLNLEFYTFKKDLKDFVSGANDDINVINHWIESLNRSMKASYGLVEVIGNTPMSSQDIDGGTIDGKVSIIIQADKIANLDYYLSTLRTKYIGIFEDLISDGVYYTSHIVIGNLNYDTEPFSSVLGQVVLVSFDISIAYMQKVSTYQDEKIKLSFDDTTYYDLPFTKANESIMFIGNQIIHQNRADTSGNVNNSATNTWVITFWLFDNGFINELQNKLYLYTCDKYITLDNDNNEVENARPVCPVNIPVYIKRTRNDISYIQKMVLTQFQKNYINNDFTIGTITLNRYSR